MSLELIPSFSSQNKHIVWYVLFSTLVCVIGFFLILKSFILFLIRCFILISYLFIHYIQTLPLLSVLSADTLSIGSYHLPYTSLQHYRIITRIVQGNPMLYGICITTDSTILYYTFRGSLSSIKQWIMTLDHYVARDPSLNRSLYEEFLDLSKL